MKVSLNDLFIVGDSILVEPVFTQETDSPFKKPSQYEDKADMGICIKWGYVAEQMFGETLKNGCIVFFNRYSTTKIRIGDTDYIFLRAEDVLAFQ